VMAGEPAVADTPDPIRACSLEARLSGGECEACQ